MSSQQQPLRINGWQNGMADSPHVGIGLIRNADIDSFPGAVKVAKQPRTIFHKISDQTFTADAGTDVCTVSTDLEDNGKTLDGAAVYFTTTDTLPAGLSTGTTYYLIQVTSKTFKVATSYKNSVGSASGTQIDITDAGTGTHTIKQLPVGTINWIIEDPRGGREWFLGSNGRVWFNTGSTAYLLNNSAIDTPASGLTNANGTGLAISSFSSTSATYLFVFRNATIDVIDVQGSTQIEALGWNNGWQSLNSAAGSTNSHQAIVAQDDAIYFCDDRYVGSIIENVSVTFDPATGATYTYNNQALDLPTQEKTECLEELGVNLLIGGNTFNKIYPWDRISSSFGLPLIVPEFAIKKMKNIGGIVYILPGTWGNIYVTQGSYVDFFRKLPTSVVNNAYSIQSNPITWGGIAEANGALIFGVAGTTSGSSGVYRLYSDGRLIHDNVPSTGSANVIGLHAKDDFYLMGYSGGADNFNLTQQYQTGLVTILQSELYRVGTKTGKAAYSELEVQLAKPSSSVGSIEVSYRTDTESAFTTMSTFTGDGTVTSFKEDAGLTDLENIQIQVKMDGPPELIEVILYP